MTSLIPEMTIETPKSRTQCLCISQQRMLLRLWRDPSFFLACLCGRLIFHKVKRLKCVGKQGVTKVYISLIYLMFLVVNIINLFLFQLSFILFLAFPTKPYYPKAHGTATVLFTLLGVIHLMIKSHQLSTMELATGWRHYILFFFTASSIAGLVGVGLFQGLKIDAGMKFWLAEVIGLTAIILYQPAATLLL